LAENFFALPEEELFARAREINGRKKPVGAGPSIAEERCHTSPPCPHCKWEFFKAKGIQQGRAHTLEETLENAKALEAMGADRTFVATGWLGYEVPREVMAHVENIRNNTSLDVYALIGAVSKNSLAELKAAGLTGYLCGIESPSERVYRTFRPGGDSLEDRRRALRDARDLGLKLWSGFLIGFGETDEEIAAGIAEMGELQPESVSILPFIPVPFTPMRVSNPANPWIWAKAAAAGTLACPGSDIFSDQGQGMYAAYGELFAPNGAYVFPFRRPPVPAG
jgi:biotin synthase